MTHRLLLDTSSLTYRAFFALPTSITGPHGRPVNAVRGYLDMTARLLVDHRPGEVIHVFDDDWRPAERVAAYDGYKSQRAEDPEGLPWQFELLAEVLGALGQRSAVAPGWEADDAIGALVEAAAAEDRVDIVTGDRDLLQLVRDDAPAVRVLFTVKGVSELACFDADAVLAKYGVPPTSYVDFAILRGDPSDGLPGVPGVGEKTARTLIGTYGTVDEVLAHADEQTPKLAERLGAAGEYLRAMRAVVPVRRDVPVQLSEPTRDEGAVDSLAEAHGLESPLERIREALDA
jgi:5'-3' exonuclease